MNLIAYSSTGFPDAHNRLLSRKIEQCVAFEMGSDMISRWIPLAFREVKIDRRTEHVYDIARMPLLLREGRDRR